MAELQSVLAATTSPSKEVREQAEAVLATLRSQSPDAFSLSLIAVIASSESSIALSALILFRRLILEDKSITLQPATHSQLRQLLTALVVPTQSLFFLKRVGEVVISLAACGKWSEDLPRYIDAWATAGSGEMKELAMYLLEIASDYDEVVEVLKKSAQSLMNFLVESLKDPSIDVRTASAKAACAFLSTLEDSQVLSYSPALPFILNVIANWCQSPTSPSERIKSIFESLSELTESVPKIWSEHLGLFDTVVISVSNQKTLDIEVRLAASETIVTLLSHSPAIVKKHKNVLERLLQTALALMCEVEDKDDLDAWAQDFDEDDVVQNTAFSVGRDLLNKIATQCGEVALPSFFSCIPQHLHSKDWTLQHTGLLAIGLVVSGCHESFKNSIKQVLVMIGPFFASVNQRLRWAAMTTLGVLCSEFAPDIELEYHASLLPAILKCTQPTSFPKVQTQAVAALVCYITGLPSDSTDTTAVLRQYAEPLFSALTVLMQSGLSTACIPLLEEVLNAVSQLAIVLKADFRLYYSRFIPGLKHIVSLPANSPQEKSVRANCIRCMGHLIENSADVAEALAIYQGLMTLKKTLEFEDPSGGAISEVASFFASALKDAFVPYADEVLSSLLSGALVPVDMSYVDASSPEAQDLRTGMEAVTFDLRGSGTKQFALNTSAMDLKTKSCRILFDMVRAMGRFFAPWVEKTVETMVALFECVYSSDIRKYAYKTVGVCSGCCQTDADTTALAGKVVPILLSAINVNSVIHAVDTKRLLKSLQYWCEATPNMGELNISAAAEIAAVLANTVQNALSRKSERAPMVEKLRHHEGEELEILETDNATDDEVIRKVMEIVGYLLKALKTAFQPLFLQYFQALYAQLLVKPEPSDVELLSAVCIFDDYMEYTGDVGEREGKSLICEQLLRWCSHPNPDVRQSAIYGVGVCAEKARKEVWQHHHDQSVQYIHMFLSDPKGRSDELAVMTDCAVSSLGKIALTHCPSLLPLWLSSLPIKAEPIEAQAVHRRLLHNLQSLAAHRPQLESVLLQLDRLRRESPHLEVLDADSVPLLARALSDLSS